MYKILTFLLSLMIASTASAFNAAYITLSDQKMRKTQLEILANNVANAHTTGYEEENTLSVKYDVKASNRKDDSYVINQASYTDHSTGPLHQTFRNLDIAIQGHGYFKILTPNGPRYTLNGNMFINNDGVLVNASGYQFSTTDNAPIILPLEAIAITITSGGRVIVDGEEIATIGVFEVPNRYSLKKEGEYLLVSNGNTIVAENYSIAQGFLRLSNVNPTRAMTDMIDIQRAYGTTTSLMNDIHELEKNAVQRISKQ